MAKRLDDSSERQTVHKYSWADLTLTFVHMGAFLSMSNLCSSTHISFLFLFFKIKIKCLFTNWHVIVFAREQVCLNCIIIFSDRLGLMKKQLI